MIVMIIFVTALGVACLNVENPESEREHLQSHGGVSGGCSHGGDGEAWGTCLPSAAQSSQ